MRNIRIEASLNREQNNYYLLNSGNILEVSYQDKNKDVIENPFKTGACVGNIEYGFTLWEAFDELAVVLDEATYKEIESRANLPADSYRNDLETLLQRCEEQNIDVSDLLLYTHIDFGNFDGIAYIDQKELDISTDLTLKDLTNDEKKYLIDDMREKMDQWENGEVFVCTLYNKNGEKLARETNLYDFSRIDNVDVKKNLGQYKDIDGCLTHNRKMFKECDVKGI